MGVLVWCSDGVMYSHVEETPRVYSGFPGCKRDEGTSVNGIFTTLTGVVLLVQMVMNIANSNNNENKKNENNQNNNNNNNVNTFDNIFVSMNENMQSSNMMSMCVGMVCMRTFPNNPAKSSQSKLTAMYYQQLKDVLYRYQKSSMKS